MRGWALVCFATVGCAGGSSTVSCPVGGGAARGVFGDILDANTQGSSFAADYAHGAFVAGSGTQLTFSSGDDVQCTGVREFSLCLPLAPLTGQTFTLGSACAARPPTATLTYRELARTWVAASGTLRVGGASPLAVTADATMNGDGLSAASGSFTVTLQATVAPFPSM